MMNTYLSSEDDNNRIEIDNAIKKTYPGLKILVRDMDLTHQISEKYKSGMIICERGFTDATPRLGGMVTTHRFVIMSNHMLDVNSRTATTADQNHMSWAWKLHMAPPGARFKVLGTHQFAGKTLIFLLHLPDDESWRLLANASISDASIGDGPLDSILLTDSIQRMERRLNQPPIPHVTSPEWLSRCRLPLGMSEDGQLFPVEYAPQSNRVKADSVSNVLIKKDGAFFEKGRSLEGHPTYPNIPHNFNFAIHDWVLCSSIEVYDDTDEDGALDDEELWKKWREDIKTCGKNEEKLSIHEKWSRGNSTPFAMNGVKIATSTISASLQTDSLCIIAIINEDGRRKFSGEMNLYISASEHNFASGSVTHWPASEDRSGFTKEAIQWDLKLPADQMAWLHDELTARPDAYLNLWLSAASYQHEGEASTAHLDGYERPETYAIEAESWTPIIEARVTVRNAMSEGPAEVIEKPELAYEPQTTQPVVTHMPVDLSSLQSRLSWVIGLLALLLIVLLLK